MENAPASSPKSPDGSQSRDPSSGASFEYAVVKESVASLETNLSTVESLETNLSAVG